MKFATRDNGTPDGELLLVSRDLRRAIMAPQVATLRQLLEQWSLYVDGLQTASDILNAGEAHDSFAFEPHRMLAPLPRAWQWLDGSAYPNHAYWMARSMGHEPQRLADYPLLYQGGSDTLLGARHDVPFPSEEHGIDFEAEVAVILDDVPMGCTEDQATSRIRLILLANDWSLRHLQAREISTGFGFIQGKPSTSFSPVAVTPDELGDHWQGDRLALPVHAHINGEWVGSPNAGGMQPGFGGLIAYAATTRKLSAGTILGGGTVSEDGPAAGSATIAEIRAIEKSTTGRMRTSFLRYGDTVSIDVKDAQGASIFGAIEQRVVPVR
ncbi:MAG: fumarylacetoacetate hydrolase family protein [Pigmentiphaga sp.]|nr:fumarylacetoacetate hydrolase family protein [Pigmentiphaga sp.]